MKPTRSAFPPMRARGLTPKTSAVETSTPDTPTSSIERSPIGSHSSDRPDREPAPIQADEELIEVVRVELQIRIVHDETRQNIGYAFPAWRPGAETRTIVGVLNRVRTRAPYTQRHETIPHYWRAANQRDHLASSLVRRKAYSGSSCCLPASWTVSWWRRRHHQPIPWPMGVA